MQNVRQLNSDAIDGPAAYSAQECSALAEMLAEILARAQALERADQRRLQSFLSTAVAILASRSYCGPADQTLFENALRNAAVERASQ
jgi:hypothetical protein